MNKKTLYASISVILLSLAGVLYFANTNTVSFGAPTLTYQKTILPITDSTYELGTSTQAWLRGNFDELCLTADSCKTSWPSGSGSSSSYFGDLLDVSTSSDATGDVYYLNASGLLTNLGIGSAGQVLKVSGGLPSWGTDSTGSSAYEIATTSGLSISQLSYFTQTGGRTTLGGVATTSLTASSPLSLSNAISVIGGGAASALSLDTSGTWTGNAGTATALAANGTNASAGNAILGVDASGNAEGAFDVWTEAENTAAAYISLTGLSATWPITYNNGTGAFTWSGLATTSNPTAGNIFYSNGTNGLIPIATSSVNVGTATALAANGTNCSAGSYPLGVDASGAVESCTDATTEIDSAISTHASNAEAHQALVTLAGSLDYLTLSGQEITRGAIDLATDITGALPLANGGTGLTTIGASSTVLTTAGTTAKWEQIFFSAIGGLLDLATQITGTLAVGNGGTGATTLNNLITLATHTTGNFIATLTSSGSITVGNSGTENAAATVNLNMAHANTWTALQTFGSASTTDLTVAGTVQLPYDVIGFTYASSSWTGTTTMLLGPAAGLQTFDTAVCETDTGTAGVSLYDGTNRANHIPTASTTVNTFTYSSNNTFTKNESRRVDIGTPASSVTKIACTFTFRPIDDN